MPRVSLLHLPCPTPQVFGWFLEPGHLYELYQGDEVEPEGQADLPCSSEQQETGCSGSDATAPATAGVSGKRAGQAMAAASCVGATCSRRGRRAAEQGRGRGATAVARRGRRARRELLMLMLMAKLAGESRPDLAAVAAAVAGGWQ